MTKTLDKGSLYLAFFMSKFQDYFTHVIITLKPLAYAGR